jgi:hypothetical protein
VLDVGARGAKSQTQTQTQTPQRVYFYFLAPAVDLLSPALNSQCPMRGHCGGEALLPLGCRSFLVVKRRSTDMTSTNHEFVPPAPDGLGLGEGAPRGLPAAFARDVTSFQTEKTQGCRLGCEFEMNMSGINFWTLCSLSPCSLRFFCQPPGQFSFICLY